MGILSSARMLYNTYVPAELYTPLKSMEADVLSHCTPFFSPVSDRCRCRISDQ